MEQTRVLQHMPRNLWRTGGRMNFPLNGLELYLPLWHPELSDSPIISKDLNAHSCTVTGTTHTPPLGRSFDGIDDKISIPHNAAFNVGTGDFTIIVWAKPSDITAVSVINKLVATTGVGWNLNLDTRLWFRIRDAAGNYAILSGIGGTTISTTAFSHIVILRSGTTLKSYINASQDTGQTQTNSGSGGATNPDTTEPILLGLKGDNTADYSGIIGGVRMYPSRALSASEITHDRLSTIWRYR